MITGASFGKKRVVQSARLLEQEKITIIKTER